MAYADQQMTGSKIVSLVIVAIIHVILGYALVTGLAYDAVKKVAEKLEVVDVAEEEEPEEPEEPPPPPPEQDLPPPPVVSPPPIVRTPVVRAPTVQTSRTPPPVFVPTPRITPPAPPPAPPAPSQAKGASPKGANRWFGRVQENYPTRAQREGREGTVGVRVSITTDGRVGNCNISKSSGHGDLDSAACEALQRYGRFDPALDDAGRPTTGSWSTSVRYEIRGR